MNIDHWRQDLHGLTFNVTVQVDEHSGPSDYRTEADDPQLFAAWRSGATMYVGVVVTADDMGDAFSASLWGIEYGSCEGWSHDVDRERVSIEYVPDLVSELLADIHTHAERIERVLKVAHTQA